ncbi:MAG: hypothetical protein BGO90_13670 [Legionella sp. 40-6]|nr:hypothetical protein [Legionella sp.]OJX98159.1 MAG: hypothetical protein BGO90_13670 [Legionella sp. 40-6]
MNKLIITASATLLTLSLVGCNSTNSAYQYTTTTVGNGVKYGANTVGTGVGYVTSTGAWVGRSVGTVAGTGLGWVTGQRVVSRDGTAYQGRQVVYHNGTLVHHNGHKYVVRNGRYVLVR